MITAIARLRSTSPYSQGKHFVPDALPNESKDETEKRMWRERMHYDIKRENEVFIPPMQFSLALKTAAKYLSIQIPGKGKSTYTKNFESGVMVNNPLYLGVKKEDVHPESVYVPSDGKVGGTTRVTKYFPIIEEWEGDVTFYILDNIITKEVFLEVLATAGNLIGVGRFRPKNRGYYGRFEVVDLKWSESWK